MKVAALIPAAGEGLRLGHGPKAFVSVGGKTLLARAVEAFGAHMDEVVVAVSPAMASRAEALVGGGARIIDGGATRQESAYRLVAATRADVVLIHDAARPFLSASIVEHVIREAGRTAAVTVAVPLADTLVRADSGATVERSALRAVQTPQGFRRELILKAHEHASACNITATDDAALVRLLGYAVTLVEGTPWLMKVTTPDDLAMAQALAESWDRARD